MDAYDRNAVQERRSGTRLGNGAQERGSGTAPRNEVLVEESSFRPASAPVIDGSATVEGAVATNQIARQLCVPSTVAATNFANIFTSSVVVSNEHIHRTTDSSSLHT